MASGELNRFMLRSVMYWLNGWTPRAVVHRATSGWGHFTSSVPYRASRPLGELSVTAHDVIHRGNQSVQLLHGKLLSPNTECQLELPAQDSTENRSIKLGAQSSRPLVTRGLWHPHPGVLSTA